MSELDDSNITWVVCPDCGAKIGVAISIGKADVVSQDRMLEVEKPPQTGIDQILTELGVDTSLIEFDEEDETIIVRPKRFLGDLWGSVNDAIRTIGGGWTREGRQSRWEIKKELIN
jgi:hypothetical protein